MKKYITPELDIIQFSVFDVVQSSETSTSREPDTWKDPADNSYWGPMV